MYFRSHCCWQLYYFSEHVLQYDFLPISKCYYLIWEYQDQNLKQEKKLINWAEWKPAGTCWIFFHYFLRRQTSLTVWWQRWSKSSTLWITLEVSVRPSCEKAPKADVLRVVVVQRSSKTWTNISFPYIYPVHVTNNDSSHIKKVPVHHKPNSDLICL